VIIELFCEELSYFLRRTAKIQCLTIPANFCFNFCSHNFNIVMNLLIKTCLVISKSGRKDREGFFASKSF